LWLSLLWIIPGALLLDTILKYIHRQIYPKPWFILQEKFRNPISGGNMIELSEGLSSRVEPLLTKEEQ
jgi:hypothetical protein